MNNAECAYKVEILFSYVSKLNDFCDGLFCLLHTELRAGPGAIGQLTPWNTNTTDIEELTLTPGTENTHHGPQNSHHGTLKTHTTDRKLTPRSGNFHHGPHFKSINVVLGVSSMSVV